MAEQNKKPTLQVPPLVIEFWPVAVGGTYFAFAVWVQKKNMGTSAAIAGIITLALFLPKMLGANAQVLSTGLTALKGIKESLPDEDINKMNSAGRKQAIDYILSRQKLRAAEQPTITDAMRMNALQSLTNPELKMLYVITKFDEQRKELLQRYGTAQSDELVRQVARHDFGIDLSDVSNISQTSKDVMSKVILSYQNTTKSA